MTRIVAGLFESHRVADLVVEHLVQEYRVPRECVRVHGQDAAGRVRRVRRKIMTKRPHCPTLAFPMKKFASMPRASAGVRLSLLPKSTMAGLNASCQPTMTTGPRNSKPAKLSGRRVGRALYGVLVHGNSRCALEEGYDTVGRDPNKLFSARPRNACLRQLSNVS